MALTASYEIDFWGKNRALSRAAQETAVATRFAKEVVVLTTIVAVGTAYFNVLTSQDRLRIARQNLTAATSVLDLIKQRFNAGTASDLDVAQQESLVASVRAAIPLLDQTLRENIAVLAVLVGRAAVRFQGQGRQPLCARHSETSRRACPRSCCSSVPISAPPKPTSPPPTPTWRPRAPPSFRPSR